MLRQQRPHYAMRHAGKKDNVTLCSRTWHVCL